MAGPLRSGGWLLLIGMLLLCTKPVVAQTDSTTRIRIENANTLRYTQRDGRKVRKLLGDVRFRQKGVRMQCDSAYQFQDENRIKAFSNVYINQGDTLRLRGAFLRYNGNTRKAVMRDSVRLKETTEKVTLTTDTLHYNIARKRAFYLSGGKIVDSANTLTSRRGYYRTAAKRFAFADSVKLTNPDYVMRSDTLAYYTPTSKAYFYSPTRITSDTNYLYCESGWYNTEDGIARLGEDTYLRSGHRELYADSLYYDRDRSRGRAMQNVRMIDTARSITLTGERTFYQTAPGSSYLTDSALAQQRNQNDTFYLHADTLKNTFDSTGSRLLKGYYGARLYNRQFQAQADSMVYRTADSTIYLYQQPVMWYENYQLTGQTMRIRTDGEGTIERLIIDNDAFIIDKEQGELYNQVKGQQVTGYFKDNVIRRMRVSGDAEAIYYPTDDADKYIGINKIKSSIIRVLFEEQEISAIHFLDKPDATIYPIGSSDPKEFRFPGFLWLTKHRPRKVADLFLPFELKSTTSNQQP